MASVNNNSTKHCGPSKQEFYAVARGTTPGIYGDWSQAKAQVDGFPGNTYKKFATFSEAKNFMMKAGILHPRQFNLSSTKIKKNTNEPTRNTQSTPKSTSNNKGCSGEDADMTDHKLPSPTSFSTPINPQPEPSSPNQKWNDTEIELNFGNPNNTALSPKPRPENPDKPANTCQRCCTLLPLLQTISERLEKLESSSCALNRLDNLESMVSSLSVDSKAIQFKMAEVNAKLNTSISTKTIKDLPTNSQRLAPSPHQQLCSASNSLKANAESSFTNKQMPLSNTAPQQSQSTTDHRRNTHNNAANPKASTQSFQPTKCVVISSTNPDKTHLNSVNQDDIRKAISNNHGPLIIDSIRKYKFDSPNPRFMVQLGTTTDVDKVVTNWKADSLGGTWVRGTMLPNEIPTGMMRGVPLDIDPVDIAQAISSKYKNSTCQRLSKSDNILRTVKVTFANREDLSDAVSNGVLLPDHNMRFRVELPYTTIRAENDG